MTRVRLHCTCARNAVRKTSGEKAPWNRVRITALNKMTLDQGGEDWRAVLSTARDVRVVPIECGECLG